MGCCHSRLERKEAVSRCKARRRYMRQFSEGRQAFAAAHSLYLHFLRSTGAALLQFANAEADLQLQPLTPSSPPPPSPLPPPPPPPPLSPSSQSWTSSVTASSTLHPPLPPPPPPPPPYSFSPWDFWDPFAPSSPHSVTEEKWEEASTTMSELTASPAIIPHPSIVTSFSKDSTVNLSVVAIPRGKKDISEIAKELDAYFIKASEAGTRVSIALEAPSSISPSFRHGISGKISSYYKSLSTTSSPKTPALTTFSKSTEEMTRTSHSCTVEKLYAWEKKLYIEVKNCEITSEKKEKMLSLLRRQEVNGADYFKVEKNKREIERLESKLMVSCQSIESTSSEIIRLCEAELFSQLVDLINGLMSMWRVMYECHQVQTHIVQQLAYLNNSSSDTATSDLHRQATLQLEAEIQNWHSAFCSLIKFHKDYIHSLAGWLRLSLFQCHHNHQNSEIYALCEEWQLAVDRIPDKVASDGIKSFLTMIHAIVAQQSEEHRQKKRSDSAFKELEKGSKELRSLESKHGPYSAEGFADKKAKVDALKAKAEEEKSRYEKSCRITRAMTLNNLQTGFPNVFQAMTGFSSACVQAFTAVSNHRRSSALSLTAL